MADFLGVENLIPARAAGVDEEGNMVFAIDGFPDPVTATDATTAAPGEPAVLGIRARDIAMGRAASSGAPNEVVGEIRESTYVGEAVVFQVRTPLLAAPLVTASREDFALGERVRLTLPAERIKVLAPDPAEPDG